MSSINAFVVSTAVEKAKAIMEPEHSLKLSERDAVALVEALHAPGRSHSCLEQAARRYRSKTQG